MTRDQAFEISTVLEALECDHDVTFRLMIPPVARDGAGRSIPLGSTKKTWRVRVHSVPNMRTLVDSFPTYWIIYRRDWIEVEPKEDV